MILLTAMIEELRSSETTIPISAMGRNIQEDGVIPSQRRKNLKSYSVLFD
jgi:hypothetical protein